MNKFLKSIAVLALIATTAACGRISTGEVGVRTSFNKTIETKVVDQGIYTSFFSHVDTFNVKETELELANLKPKAKDNLTLADLDISIFYTVNPTKVAEMEIKYSGMSSNGGNTIYPMFNLVKALSQGAVFDVVGNKYDSLTIHNQRSQLEQDILKEVQTAADKNDKGIFTITKVIVRSVVTDKALEESIQNAVKVEKQIQAKRQQVELAKAEAERQRIEALGTAAANTIIANSLDARLIELKRIEATQAFATQGTHTVVLQGDSKPLINLPSK